MIVRPTLVKCYTVTALLLLVASIAVEAQPPGKMWKIGYLGGSAPDAAAPLVEAFRLGLREHGWNEGQSVQIEYRWAHGKNDVMLELARDLVRAQVDVIVASYEPLIVAAKQATATIPIVMVAPSDPVGNGLVATLAHPGGNVTGLSLLTPDLAGKRFELLREIAPRASRVAILWNSDNAAKAQELSATQVAARGIGLKLQSLPVRPAESDFRAAFAAMRGEQAQAVIVLGDAFTFLKRREIAALAATSRLPSMWESGTFLDAGGLIAYGPDLRDNFRRAAGYVEKILKGAKPAHLPVEQPIKFELAINMKTAKALGLAAPRSLLLRADQIIE
jgi:ABC-type uncharacterized transport system substrate-binding protein